MGVFFCFDYFLSVFSFWGKGDFLFVLWLIYQVDIFFSVSVEGLTYA